MKSRLIKNKENIQKTSLSLSTFKKMKKLDLSKTKLKYKNQNRKRPNAPHNTSLYLIENFSENEKLRINFLKNETEIMNIDNFISIGGTMKGILDSYIANL